MATPKIKNALREIMEFLLSDKEQFTSVEAYEERKKEVIVHFYDVYDHICGEPKGDAAE